MEDQSKDDGCDNGQPSKRRKLQTSKVQGNMRYKKRQSRPKPPATSSATKDSSWGIFKAFKYDIDLMLSIDSILFVDLS